jgi:hypothetical protein
MAPTVTLRRGFGPTFRDHKISTPKNHHDGLKTEAANDSKRLVFYPLTPKT